MTALTEEPRAEHKLQRNSSREKGAARSLTFVVLRPEDAGLRKAGPGIPHRTSAKRRWIILAGVIMPATTLYLLFVLRVCGC